MSLFQIKFSFCSHCLLMVNLITSNKFAIRLKSELIDKKFYIFSLPWEFETDWYTINFIY